MNIKSLLLGSAATLVAVSGARAADAVVVAEPEPAEYVRVCDTYGAGFYYIPGTETCLKISGYMRYDIGAGDAWGLTNVIDKRNPFDVDPATGLAVYNTNDTWDKTLRFALRADARSETELGTLRAYLQYDIEWDTNRGTGDTFFDEGSGTSYTTNGSDGTSDSQSGAAQHIDTAYLELGGFRAGKLDSYFSTFTDYTINIIHDDNIIPYGPYDTAQMSYTFDPKNGFTAGVSIEQGHGNRDGNDLSFVNSVGDTQFVYRGDIYTIDSYAPDVVAGIGYESGWGSIKVVGGYDSNFQDFAVKAKLTAKFNDMFSLFVQGGWADKSDLVVTDSGDNTTQVTLRHAEGNYYGNWGGQWAVWGGGSVQFNPKTSLNAQVAYDDWKDFSAIANIDYELVPGLHIQPEVGYLDNFASVSTDPTDNTVNPNAGMQKSWNGFVRIQRNF